jgi:hypothetical protein
VCVCARACVRVRACVRARARLISLLFAVVPSFQHKSLLYDIRSFKGSENTDCGLPSCDTSSSETSATKYEAC